MSTKSAAYESDADAPALIDKHKCQLAFKSMFTLFVGTYVPFEHLGEGGSGDDERK